MKRNYLYPSLMALCLIGFWAFENFYGTEPYPNENQESAPTAFPQEFLPSSTTGNVVAHTYFSFSYNEPYEQAEWVLYSLSRDQLTQDNRKRPYFREDPKVESKSADWRNYSGSGYDRGHLCPAGDRRFSEQAYNETFYTSNIAPQDKAFNAGVWNRLEQQVRSWARKYDTLFVVTGGVLEKGLPKIGKEDVAVPRHFYKIVARQNRDGISIIAFLMEHRESTLPLDKFVVSVDKLEGMTGIDFFRGMPKNVQARLEKDTNGNDWGF